jgi:hypothetical protein
MALPTLLDVAKRNAADSTVGLIDEAARQVPEVSGSVVHMGRTITVPNVGAARTINGTQYKTLVRTALPTAQFRNANQGVPASKSTLENRLIETFILNARWESDKAVADGNEDGAESMIAEEAVAVVAANMMLLGKQFYYGRGGSDSKGHPGLVDMIDAAMVEDAAGDSANQASSVYAVSFGPGKVQWVMGRSGQLDVSDVREESITDEDGNRFTAYVQELLAYIGVQVGNKFSVARLKNITTQDTKTLNDSKLGKLLARYPVGYSPDAMFLSRRSLEQLRSSRTATNDTGREAPIPTDYMGIPLIPTDSILDTEAIA